MITLRKDAPAPHAVSTRPRRRAIGRWGTTARLIVAVVWVGNLIQYQVFHGFDPAPWLLGLLGFPALLLAWQWLRVRHNPRPMHATGPVGHLVNLAILAALLLTPRYAPWLSVTADATAIFYGTSMLLAAARGYAGCEVLAVSNWLMRRDDQVGCVLFTPLDHLEHRSSA